MFFSDIRKDNDLLNHSINTLNKKGNDLYEDICLAANKLDETNYQIRKCYNNPRLMEYVEFLKGIGQYFGKTIMDDIYKKIDPHEDMKQLSYHISYNEKSKGELYITLNDRNTNKGEYRPEIYFSTAQLNTVAFSSFISRALDNHADLALNSIFIDDPVCSFDEMNVLGFADLIRSIIETSNHQIMISTHDEKVFRILKRKLNENYYSSCFLALPQGNSSLRYSHEEKNN